MYDGVKSSPPSGAEVVLGGLRRWPWLDLKSPHDVLSAQIQEAKGTLPERPAMWEKGNERIPLQPPD